MACQDGYELLDAIKDFSLQAFNAWWRMSIICEMFFTWYVEHSMSVQLERLEDCENAESVAIPQHAKA
jgi:hypothetical protein